VLNRFQAIAFQIVWKAALAEKKLVDKQAYAYFSARKLCPSTVCILK
jgi:hypothetical protein